MGVVSGGRTEKKKEKKTLGHQQQYGDRWVEGPGEKWRRVEGDKW